MTGYYTGKAEAGKIYACKQCGKVPVVGQDRFYEKKDDKWIGCIDFECFKQQGGSSEKSEKKGFGGTSAKFKLEQVQVVTDITDGLLKHFIDTHSKKEVLGINDRAIMFESLFRTVSGNFKA